jgi:hypothetical protein
MPFRVAHRTYPPARFRRGEYRQTEHSTPDEVSDRNLIVRFEESRVDTALKISTISYSDNDRPGRPRSEDSLAR